MNTLLTNTLHVEPIPSEMLPEYENAGRAKWGFKASVRTSDPIPTGETKFGLCKAFFQDGISAADHDFTFASFSDIASQHGVTVPEDFRAALKARIESCL